ncbi:fumarylacetoacetate hydrolase family protein [Granulicoccus sp. GXG6511]|uniref:fumarylacetoacetate hydrolase family protein n=1 Tax=Granulicoccus sp. GXG6511 TaxID=3381351 RepID=UPI003D7CE59D
MKLATLRHDTGTIAVRIDGDSATALGAPTVEALLADPARFAEAGRASGPAIPLSDPDYAPVVTWPGKIICVGQNYLNHILEMGREAPDYPTLFTKFPEALIGARDDIQLPPESDKGDWECELAIVIGRPVRRATEAEADAAIAGFTIINDISMRDWQNRTLMWDQGKTWEHSAPFGPWLVTPDELPGGTRPALEVRCLVDGEVMQSDNTRDLVFDPVALVQYVSTILTLKPGDVIASGTSGGVGHARKPPRYLTDGAEVITEIEHLGRCINRAVAEEI